MISYKRRKQTQVLLHLSPDLRQERVNQVVVLHAQLLRRLRLLDGVAIKMEPAQRCQSESLHLERHRKRQGATCKCSGGHATGAGRHLIDLTSIVRRAAYASINFFSAVNFLILKDVSEPSAYQSVNGP